MVAYGGGVDRTTKVGNKIGARSNDGMSKREFFMRILLLSSSLILGATGVAFAQYTGPSITEDQGVTDPGALAKIQTILDNPIDGEDVVLEGFLVRKVGDEMYVLSDGVSEIHVEIDDDDFPSGKVSETTRVRIEGEVDTHRIRELDIEADRVFIID